MMYENPSWIVDGVGGGYALTGYANAPSEHPEVPIDLASDVRAGTTIVVPHVAFVMAMGALEIDKRVFLQVLASNRPVAAYEKDAMARGPGVMCEFQVDARAPILISSLSWDYQGWVTQKPGHFDCCLFMRTDPEPLVAGEPLEYHRLHIWPTIASDATIGWFDRDLDLSLTSNLRVD